MGRSRLRMLRGEFTRRHDRASTIPGSLSARPTLLLPFVALSILPVSPRSVNNRAVVRAGRAARHQNRNMNLKAIADTALRLVFPPRCVLCGREDVLLCAPCHRTLPARLDADALPKLSAVRAARAVWPYEGHVHRIVRQYKYAGLRALAPLLAAEMSDVLRTWNPPVSVIAHVPGHKSRLRERGFDQAELLAREVSAASGIPAVSALTRTRETRARARTLSIAQRADNVRAAFTAADPDAARGRAILLIDDVITTGATLRESARALREAGAAGVWALTLAHET